jgi:hypothetical protein
MLKYFYPYRIKTEIEFITEYGNKWKSNIGFNHDNDMDYLFGQVLPYTIFNINNLSFVIDDRWILNKKMIISNDLNINSRYYKFKIRQEFEREFGNNWKNIVRWNSNTDMDYLLGQVYPYESYYIKTYHPKIDGRWTIFERMIKLYEPTYKPRILDKTI